ARPGVFVGDYVGSWYPDYASLGANWASRKFHAEYTWMMPDYNRTGYAELVDMLAVGLYYPNVTIEEAQSVPLKDYYSVEGAADMAQKVVSNAAPLIGTLYLLQYKDNPHQFVRAVQMARQKTNGVGIFDAVYLANYDWWDELETALKGPAEVLPLMPADIPVEATP
ncbi:MAG TPA: alpha amylase family protein, partial [bacterium]|nr:alpha amylase family protein [bacterium]